MPSWAFQSRRGPSAGQAVDQPVSFDMPLLSGPRHRGQSSPAATPDGARPRRHVAVSSIERPKRMGAGSRLPQAVSTRTPRRLAKGRGRLVPVLRSQAEACRDEPSQPPTKVRNRPEQSPLVSPPGRFYISPVMREKSFCSCQEFTARVRELGPLVAGIREADSEGLPGSAARGLADNRFYHFDTDAARGLMQTVEEMAIEEATGTLLTALGEFTDFDSGRERYEQLAMALDRVEVIG